MAAVTDEMVAWIREQLDDDERAIARIAAASCHGVESTAEKDYFRFVDRASAELDAKRRILDEHAPEWRTVEWPHDQNGKGEAQVCRRCQNAEHTEWHPAVGEAGVLPEGFVAPYVLAPCVTLRMLALSYADSPGYREEWRP